MVSECLPLSMIEDRSPSSAAETPPLLPPLDGEKHEMRAMGTESKGMYNVAGRCRA